MDTLFKYFNWGDHESRKILTEQELYFCNASKWKNFGEFDFNFKTINPTNLKDQIAHQIGIMDWKEHDKYVKWLNVHLHIYKVNFTDYYTLPSQAERDIFEMGIREVIIDKRVQDIINNPAKYERITRIFYFKRTGIFSTSTSKESIPLWGWKQNFDGNKNGDAVCIGIDFIKVKELLDKVGNYTLGSINYQGQKNQVDFLGSGDEFLINRLNSITYTLPQDKVKDIDQQKEVRILKFLTNDTSDKSPERFLQLSNDCIKEIIIHQNASDNTQKEVQEIAKAIGCSNVSYFKS